MTEEELIYKTERLHKFMIFLMDGMDSEELKEKLGDRKCLDIKAAMLGVMAAETRLRTVVKG